MKVKNILISCVALIVIGCDDDSTTVAVDPCPALQTDADTKILALFATPDAATCATALAAVTALKDGSCNASTQMVAIDVADGGDGVTWAVDAADVSEVQEMCDAYSAAP